MLMNPNDEPVQPVLQYLKFKDNSGAALDTVALGKLNANRRGVSIVA
ncbi:hypothetical protein M5X11_25555 [Paenibacillus alginolyticus]|nr:hypothetical protein [Paenibacillus alginolyticus]MCY9668250.1 hypothetical protein [Paenibacillus alginolyticus]